MQVFITLWIIGKLQRIQRISLYTVEGKNKETGSENLIELVTMLFIYSVSLYYILDQNSEPKL